MAARCEGGSEMVDQLIGWLARQRHRAPIESTDVDPEYRVEIYEGSLQTEGMDGRFVGHPVEHGLRHAGLTDNVFVRILVGTGFDVAVDAKFPSPHGPVREAAGAVHGDPLVRMNALSTDVGCRFATLQRRSEFAGALALPLVTVPLMWELLV